jgi:hypothetical protein
VLLLGRSCAGTHTSAPRVHCECRELWTRLTWASGAWRSYIEVSHVGFLINGSFGRGLQLHDCLPACLLAYQPADERGSTRETYGDRSYAAVQTWLRLIRLGAATRFQDVLLTKRLAPGRVMRNETRRQLALRGRGQLAPGCYAPQFIGYDGKRSGKLAEFLGGTVPPRCNEYSIVDTILDFHSRG